jgi:biotin/methionine sulfoxide reductase
MTRRVPSLAHWGAFTALVEDGKVVGVEPFARDPAPSPILASIPAMVHSPLRIARPAVREGWLTSRDRARTGSDRFVEVPWDEALGLVADEVARVRAERGADGIFGGSYGWSSAGRVHHARSLVRRYLYAGGGCVDQTGNYSWGAAQMLLPHVIGGYEALTGRVSDWDDLIANTGLIVAFGGLPQKNAQVTSGGSGEHLLAGNLAKAREKGIRIVMVSPTRDRGPGLEDAEWIPIRPHTDTAMLLAMAQSLVAAGRHDAVFLDRCCVGFETFRDHLMGVSDGLAKTPEWAEGICGVPADRIASLARQAADHRTYMTLTYSLQRAHRGEMPYWAGIALAATLGQIGLPGGGIGFGHGSMGGVGHPRRDDVPGPEIPLPRNPHGRSIPVARIADMLLEPGGAYRFDGRDETYPDVGLIYWAGGNPFHHHQDLNRLRRAWERPETVIVHDVWWTATAKAADIVLPATTMLERDDVGGSSRDRFVLAMHKAIDPVGEARNDLDIFTELAARAGVERAFTGGLDAAGWRKWIYDRIRVAAKQAAGVTLPDFQGFWEAGFVEIPPPRRSFVMLADFRGDPVHNPLKTASGRIEIASAGLAARGDEDVPGHPLWRPPVEWLGAPAAATHPLHLLTVQPADRLHSQMAPGPVAQGNRLAGRETIRINPVEAASRGIGPGDPVRVFNGRGACIAACLPDADVMPGVAVMSTGAWFDPDPRDPGAAERQGNPNVLTLDIGTSSLGQGTSAQTALVQVERWEGPLPPSRLAPPELVPA